MATLVLSYDSDSIARAAGLLRDGHLVAMPTETVYGLAADATSASAVAGIFAAKDRPSFNPLICHYPDAAAVAAHVALTPLAHRLAERFWPGALTLVLPRQANCPVQPAAAAGLPTLAVRVPSHPAALALLRAAARPLAAPSANRSGGVSPTTAAHVLADLDGRIAAVIDAGPCRLGLESTVLDMTRERALLLRPGAIAQALIEACIGPIDHGHTPGATLASPGLLAVHYAPRLRLRLNATAAEPHEALLAFGPVPESIALTYNLSEFADLDQAAQRLFDGLRWLDETGIARGLTGIAVMPIPTLGIGAAIHDRLSRAAA